jgi:hypothetical protein
MAGTRYGGHYSAGSCAIDDEIVVCWLRSRRCSEQRKIKDLHAALIISEPQTLGCTGLRTARRVLLFHKENIPCNTSGK